tara:strand:- start:538 stop:1188 length:651 start_codon:yes stop_codon:yes gene_type:complete
MKTSSWRKFLLEQKESRKGYKIVATEGGKLFSLQNPDLEYSAEVGAVESPSGGIYLGTTKDFVKDYYTDMTDKQDALLTYEYFPEDVISGNIDETGEIKVKKAKLESIEVLGSQTIIAYHGSNVPIRKFSRDFGAQGVMWFSEDKDKILRGESGALSSKYIMKVELTVDKTAGWDEYDKLYLQQIEDEGFDSIQLDENWIMFDPKRIKVLEVEKTR